MTTATDIIAAIGELGLAGRVVCVHSSLRSFGHVEGGAGTVVEAFVAAGCTLVAPTFTYNFMLRSQAGMRPARNGTTYGTAWDLEESPAKNLVYRPQTNEVSREMGRIPAELLLRPGRVRGNHPICSFAAVGPRAREVIDGQDPMNVYAPLAMVARLGGTVVLMGVGLQRLTLLHYAEQAAGRVIFRRWANGQDGKPMMAETGGCSEGFGNLMPVLRPVVTERKVGQSAWLIMPAEQTVHLAAAAIRRQPMITHCGKFTCERCRDAVAGGPVVIAD
jgi:aminoglycoside 3-N-acetyltransferase